MDFLRIMWNTEDFLMAHFYGVMEGNGKQVTRCGTRALGIKTTAASWQGSVRVYLYEKDGEDYALVQLEPWHGEGTNQTLYRGPVSGRKEEQNDVED